MLANVLQDSSSTMETVWSVLLEVAGTLLIVLWRRLSQHKLANQWKLIQFLLIRMALLWSQAHYLQTQIYSLSKGKVQLHLQALLVSSQVHWQDQKQLEKKWKNWVLIMKVSGRKLMQREVLPHLKGEFQASSKETLSPQSSIGQATTLGISISIDMAFRYFKYSVDYYHISSEHYYLNDKGEYHWFSNIWKQLLHVTCGLQRRRDRCFLQTKTTMHGFIQWKWCESSGRAYPSLWDNVWLYTN